MRRLAIVILITCVALLTESAESEAPSDSRRPMSVLAQLIDQADSGSTIVPPPGIYEGNLRIHRPVTLDGRGEVIFDGLGEGTVVEISSADVTLRNIIVRASGNDVPTESAGIRAVNGPVVIEGCTVENVLFGIDLRESPGSIIRNNTVVGMDLEPGRRGDGIRLWWSHDCTIEGNFVRDSRDMVFWYSENLRINRNRVTRSRYGLHFMYSHDTELRENDLWENSVGVYLMYSNRITLENNRMRNNRGASGYGIGLKDCDDIIVSGNALLANRVGAYIDNSPSSVDSTGLFEANLIAFNEVGLLATPNTHDNVFTGNSFIENEDPAATHGRGKLMKNAFTRDGIGNFWSDYAGFDRDGNGIGDLPYEATSLFGAMLAREPNLRLFVHSPAQQAIEFTARALPELQPQPIFIDAAPLARPPTILAISDQATSMNRWPMVVTGAALVVLAGMVLVAIGRTPNLTVTAGANP